jgi:hypothetical protein
LNVFLNWLRQRRHVDPEARKDIAALHGLAIPVDLVEKVSGTRVFMSYIHNLLRISPAIHPSARD